MECRLTRPHHRVHAGTDLAMIGAWDAGRGDCPLPETPNTATLEREAAEGHLFLIHTGADCGGPVDVFVDAEVPDEHLRHARLIDGEFLLSIPSGRLVVGGAEDYRVARPRITGKDSIVSVPAGDYRVRCHIGVDENVAEVERQLQATVGAADLRWFDRLNLIGVAAGFSTLLLFPLLAWPLGWKVALPVTLAVFIAYWWVWEWVTRRSPKYRRLAERVTPFRLQNAAPLFILELHRLADRGSLKGGSIRL